MRSDPQWDGVLAVEQLRALPGSRAICHPRAHVVILHLNPPYPSEWRIGGEALRLAAPQGRLSLIGRGTRAQWMQPLEAHVLTAAVDAGFINGLAGRPIREQIAFRDRVAFDDPAIVHIMLALRSELGTDCATGRLY